MYRHFSISAVSISTILDLVRFRILSFFSISAVMFQFSAVFKGAQIREQMSGPDLHAYTLKFWAIKKTGFSPINNTFQNFLTFVYLYSMQLFSADPTIFSKKFEINFLLIKTLKNGPQKLLIIDPNLFFSQSSPAHSPHPRIDFSYYKYVPRHICLLICEMMPLFLKKVSLYVHI